MIRGHENGKGARNTTPSSEIKFRSKGNEWRGTRGKGEKQDLEKESVSSGAKRDKMKRNDSKKSREINLNQFPFSSKKIMGCVYMTH
jgi:hypothetical protein